MPDQNHGGSYILFRLSENMLLPKGEILEEKSKENHTEQGWIQDALMIELNSTGMDLRKTNCYRKSMESNEILELE